jgi:hypothetical protein
LRLCDPVAVENADADGWLFWRLQCDGLQASAERRVWKRLARGCPVLCVILA